MIKLFKNNPLVAIMYLIAFLFIIFFGSDIIFSRAETSTGTVVDRQYKPEHTSNSSSYVISSDGKSHYVTTTSHESEEFLIMIKDESGEVYTANSNSRIYYSKKIGDRLNFKMLRGYFTNGIWNVSAKEDSYE